MNIGSGIRHKEFFQDFLKFLKFSRFRAHQTSKKSTVSTQCYRRMGQGMGQGVTHTLPHTVLGSKSKKNHRFLIENGGFLVAEAGLEPTTSGL